MSTATLPGMGNTHASRTRARIHAGFRLLHGLPNWARMVGAVAACLPFMLAETWYGPALPGHPFILLLPAVLAATVMFRWQGGAAAIAANSVYTDWYHLSPHGLGVGDPFHALSLAVFIAGGLFAVTLVSLLHAAMDRQAALLREVAEARDRAEEARREKDLVVHELNHRVKNAIASVASVARQTATNAKSVEEFMQGFQGRIDALSKTHDLIALGGWGNGASLREVLDGELRPYRGALPCELEGADVRIGPKTALSLGLVFHELATNASKYGALSPRGAGLRVSWGIHGGRLEVAWRERTTEPPREATRKGFGTRLLSHSIRALGGEVEREAAPEGYRFRIAVPVDALAA